MANDKLDWAGDWRGPKSLGTMTLGTGWHTVGTAFACGGARYLNAFMDITVNLSTDVRVRLQGLHESGGTAYDLAIATASASVISVEPEYVEFNVDADASQSLTWELYGVYPYAQLQACVGTAGGTAAYVNGVYLVSAR